MQQNPISKDRLRVLVFGAGAIGTYIGGSLALQGHTLVFLERPQVAEELLQRGLRLEIDGRERRIPSPRLAASIEQALDAGPFDVGVFALKSYHTRAALESLKPHHQALPPILCLQNGVDNEPAIAEVLGASKVIAGTVTSAVGRRLAGDVILERERGVGIASTHPLSPALAGALGAAGLNVRLYRDAAGMKWSKLLTNLVANATSAILDMSPAEIFAHPGLYRLEIGQLRETLAVMRAQGVQVVDLPATPARLLALGAKLPASLARPLMQRAVGSGRGGKMPSLHIDLYSGRGKSEVDYLNGAVARHSEKLGVPTPINRLLNQTLLALTRGELPLEEFSHQPDRLIPQSA